MSLSTGGYTCPKCQFNQATSTPFCPNCGRVQDGPDGPNKANDPLSEPYVHTQLLMLAKQNQTLLYVILLVLALQWFFK